MIAFLIGLALTGLIVGALARLALPGRDPMTIPQTMLVGIAGSLLAGLIGVAIFGRTGAPFILSVLVTTGLVYGVRRSRGGTLTSPARGAGHGRVGRGL